MYACGIIYYTHIIIFYTFPLNKIFHGRICFSIDQIYPEAKDDVGLQQDSMVRSPRWSPYLLPLNWDCMLCDKLELMHIYYAWGDLGLEKAMQWYGFDHTILLFLDNRPQM